MEIRRVGLDGFEEIYPLLVEFDNPRMSKEDWRQMLFSYPWPAESRHGFGYYAEGKMVGFIGAIFSTRQLDGRNERFCNLSTWIVRKEFRGTSILLTRRVIDQLAGHTLVGLTPAPTTRAVFARLGFLPLETEQLLLFPLGSPRDLWRALRGSFTVSPRKLRSAMVGTDATIYRDLSPCSRIHHLLIANGGRQCYIVARREKYKRIPVAELLHVSDLDFFWEHRLLAHAGVLRVTGTAVLALDSRFARRSGGGDHAPFRATATVRVPRERIYRPSRPDIATNQVDGLYSELMTLRE